MPFVREQSGGTYSSGKPLYWVNCGKSASNNNTGIYYDENTFKTDLTSGIQVTGKYFSFTVTNLGNYTVTCNVTGQYHKFNLLTNTYSKLSLTAGSTFAVNGATVGGEAFIIWLD